MRTFCFFHHGLKYVIFNMGRRITTEIIKDNLLYHLIIGTNLHLQEKKSTHYIVLVPNITLKTL